MIPSMIGVNGTKEEMQIIDCPLFQRLNWVSQLSCKQIFPGGVHTRFIHSLGAMKLAGQYMSHLLETLEYDTDEATSNTQKDTKKLHKTLNQLARLAGLLHDIGHGPFSHPFDRAIYSEIYGIPDGGHDLHRLKMIKSDYFKPLIMACGITPEQLIAVWNSQYRKIKMPLLNGRIGMTLSELLFKDHLVPIGWISPCVIRILLELHILAQ